MRTKRSIWEVIYSELTFKQYVKVANSYGQMKDGLNNLSYDTYFKRVLKLSRSKRLCKLASEGLTAPFTLQKECI